MLPLNYAILNYFLENTESSAIEIMGILREDYGNHKQFKLKEIEEVLMTAEKNSILYAVKCEIKKTDELVVYYSVTEYGEKIISKYIR